MATTAEQREQIGKKLREARKEKGWSVRRLVEESGVSRGSVVRIERGIQAPRRTSRELEQALGMDSGALAAHSS